MILKAIEGYPNYQVSDCGKVWSLKRQIFLKWGFNAKGYPKVNLWENGRESSHRVHRLVALAHVDGYEEGLQVNHKDGIKTNNDATNLEWCTGAQNIQHAYDTGLCSGIHSGALPKAVQATGAVVGLWFPSIRSSGRSGFHPGSVSSVTNGRAKTHAGYKWEFV
jgi:hypothetical protein